MLGSCFSTSFSLRRTPGSRRLIRTVDGKKVRGYFVRFDGDTIVLHDRPTGWLNPVTKLVSLRKIKTLQVDRRRTNKLAIPLAVPGGIAILGLLAGSKAILGAYASSAFMSAMQTLRIGHAPFASLSAPPG